MEFKEFKAIQQKHLKKLFKNQTHLFTTAIDKEEIYNIYLDSFPEGSNEIFRERREFDCSCCKHFIRSFGNVIAIINDYKIATIWDFDIDDPVYSAVIKKLSEYVKSKPIADVFITKERFFGTDLNHEQLEDGTIRTWHHFRAEIPLALVNRSVDTVDTVMSNFRSAKEVFARSLKEISTDAVDTVLDLIAQKSLYKGDEWKAVLQKFRYMQEEHKNVKNNKIKDAYYWKKSIEAGGAISRIKNHSIGKLLIDITNNVDINVAVKSYEAIVAPTNYKRPKAIFTKKMIEDAQKTISDMGYLDSLERRFAVIDDITINNILFANKEAKKLSTDVFDTLKEEVAVSPKKFGKVEEIPIETFVEDVLPRVSRAEVLFENRLENNLVSLIAPVNKDAKTMFKWNNNFSWAYNGNITDSDIKTNVAKAGGNVKGVLRFSIQWNENNDNKNDFDAHCIEPDHNHICYYNKGTKRSGTTGNLDVDIIHPTNSVAVENIVWTDIDKMREGTYHFYVNCYSNRGGKNGFRAEIEYNGEIYEYDYSRKMRLDEQVTVAKIKFSRSKGIEFIESLDSDLSISSKKIWNLQTNQFYPISVFMFSPNYWDEQKGIGHKHYMFMIDKCINDTSPNGFFNEFLKEDLSKHKRVFEALGSKMAVTASNDQLSGLGFSSTKRNEIICKLEGNVSRVVKLKF